MAIILKLTPGQYDKLKADTLYYEVGCARFLSKSSVYELECEPAAARKVKQLVED